MSLLGVGREVGGGLVSYVRYVARALAARSSESYVFFAPAALLDHWRRELPEGSEVVGCSVASEFKELRAIYEVAILPKLARRVGCEVLFYSNTAAPLSGASRCVVAVHDLMHLSQPTHFPWHKRLYLRLTYKKLARSAARIVTGSEFSRLEIHDRLGVQLERITAIPSGVEDAFFWPGSHPWPPGLPRLPYSLSVAAAYPHKRLPLLIRAFERVAEARVGMMLVLAGTHVGQRCEQARLETAIARSPEPQRILRLPPIPWQAMPAIYANAAALVHASSYEGFGLPIAEAMAVGLPVAAAPSQAVREVLAGWGEIASGWGEEDLSEAIEKVLAWGPGKLERYVQGSRRLAETRYRWSRVAECLATEFRAVALRGN